MANGRAGALEGGERDGEPRDHAIGARHHAGAGDRVLADGRKRGDIAERAILGERGADERFQIAFRQREAQARRVRRWRRRHSPTSCAGAFAGAAPPPMDTMRSIARRAREAMSGGTVMRCSSFWSELSTAGSVVTFMNWHEARSSAARNWRSG